MKAKFLLLFTICFMGLKAQKAYDIIKYEGRWKGFIVTLNFADGYEVGNEIITYHIKTKKYKKYSVNRYSTDKRECLGNNSNNVIFCFRKTNNTILTDNVKVTIFWDSSSETFMLHKVKN